jgi:AAA+ ATPase superfamily predicted ATPase
MVENVKTNTMSNLHQITSPFLFGKTVSENLFINRTADIERLWLNLSNGINTVLISPRRWGKTSLVKHTALLKKEEKKIKWCFIDMFSIRIDPMHDFSLSFKWEDVEIHKNEILNLPETIAKKYGIQLFVCIDEFQNIHTFKNADTFEKNLRACWQHHQKVSYCFSGNKKTLMADIFNKKNRAFYRFGDIIILNKIATEHWLPFITKQFAETGKLINTELALKIVSLMKEHPYYVQQLSHYVWEHTCTEVTSDILEFALDRMLAANTALYQTEIENLSNTQIGLLKAIVNGEKQFTSVKTMQKYRIGTPQNVSKNIKTLLNQDFIEKHLDNVELLDPAFELWFNNYYLDNKK